MYDLYKPLRNRLRGLALIPSLVSVYQFCQFLQFDQPLPASLRYPGFGLQRGRRESFRVGLLEWTLELLARELILNAPDRAPKAMTTWNEYADPTGRLAVLPEQRYGTRQRPRDSADLIVRDASGSIFIECKASRLRAQAKVDLNDTATIEGELERLAGFVVQLYATIADALEGSYPHWQPDGSPVFPMVVTLDEWLPSGQMLVDTLTTSIRTGLQARGLRPELLNEHPYTLCSLDEYEVAAKIIAAHSVAALMLPKTAGEHHTWAMMAFIQNHFRGDLQNRGMLFEREWNALSDNLRGPSG